MRILIVTHGHPDFSIGGAEVASYTLFNALGSIPGHDVFYLSRAPGIVPRRASTPLMSLGHGERECFVHTGDWDEFWLSNSGIEDLSGPIAEYLLFLNPDVVHLHHIIGFGVEALALIRRILPDTRIVITLHEYLAICHNHGQMVKRTRRDLCARSSSAECHACFPERSPAEFYNRQVSLQNHFAVADAYVSPSQFLLERYADWGLDRARLHVIDNGVSGSPEPPRTIGPSGRRDRFGFFGQISEFKGLHIVLEAISRIPDEIWGSATLNVFGGNLEFQPEAFQIRFHTLLQAVGRRARFCGSYRQSDLPSLMREVDWVVMPSIWWENSPVVIQEAFLHRRPPIVSGIGGMAEKVRDGVDGLHFRVASPESLADQLIRALEGEDLWSRLAAAAPTPLSPASFAHAHLALYEALPRGRAAAPSPQKQLTREVSYS